MLRRWLIGLELAAVKRDTIDWIWKVIEAKFVFEASTIKRMELILVLNTLKWRMQAITACSFIDYFLHKFNDHDSPSMLAFSRSTDLSLSTTKGAIFLVFRPSEIATSVALVAFGERNTSVVERATANCKLQVGYLEDGQEEDGVSNGKREGTEW